MQRVAIFILILALAGGAYWLLAGDGPSASDGGGGGETPLEGDGDRPAPKGDGGTPGMTSATPEGTARDPEPKALQAPTRLMLIGKHAGTWSELVLMVCGRTPDLEYRSWYLLDKNGAGPGYAGKGRGMKELTSRPTADDLVSLDIRVLVLDTIDPNSLPKSFWETVQRRVESGTMGLAARPGFPAGEGGIALTVHPMLTHPIVKALLPVANPLLIEGTPVPGVFSEKQPLEATAVGNRHPASRLVEGPKDSRATWQMLSSGDGAFATQFCYPIQEVRPGAQTLVECKAATSVAAVVATAPDATERVLWMGNVDFGHRTHYVPKRNKAQQTLVNHWIVWLAGQAE